MVDSSNENTKPSESKPELGKEGKSNDVTEITLEEDDLFEEFANEAVAEEEENDVLPLWAPEWEDEDIGDNFATRLKAELQIK
mmetsp:Transcript_33532/g.79581  ORF Transcript_33532/g.79581 Transcript_33532/m.79581 type:complete len:83 (+) Transcript_33532:110-358(+)|eukprot:CAMPEP_0177599212 /NCGR_PEP_ID=MMETSP0419_2-20121207/12848_1 /TAXON_ID=582737 /ORGANISM="Tetraselmis sp., Strain GSL018" /LENGTH=82 /DNA_ID=CAMNT_0019091881 /DNA_START=88 /DNA_END=336 /DNA_ORIENTATION=+